MATSLFFDLTESGLSVYSLAKNGKGDSANRITAELRSDFSFSTQPALSGSEGDCWLSLPLSFLGFRVLELPFSDPAKIRELLPFEVEGLILGDPKEYVFDIRVLGSEGEGSRVLVCFILKEKLRSILAGFTNSGVDPKCITSLELGDALRTAGSAEALSTALLIPREGDSAKRIASAAAELSAPTVNFRQGEFAWTRDSEKAQKSLRTAALLAFLILAVFGADSILSALTAARAARSSREEIRKTYAAMFPGEKKVTDELYQTKAHLKDLRDRQDTLAGVSPLGVLDDLSKIAMPGLSFHEITVQKDLIVLKGECASLGEAGRVKTELERFLQDVSLSDSRASASNRTVFTITAKGRRAGS